MNTSDTRPLVSVVIPCYNYAHYLPEAVESVVRQTRKDFEIIIVDDGSTDDTAVVAEGLARKYAGHEITVVRQRNMGLPAARNSGIRAARGEYIQPLDADDLLAETCLEETLPVLISDPGLAFVYPGYTLFGEVSEGDGSYRIDQEYDFNRLLKVNFVIVCALFRKKAWEDVGGYTESMRLGYEDWEFYIKLGKAGLKGRFLDRPLYLYRKHGTAMLKGSNKKHAAICARIRRLHPELYYPRAARYSRTLARACDYVKEYLRDPVAHYLYRKHPGLHSLLKRTRDSL